MTALLLWGRCVSAQALVRGVVVDSIHGRPLAGATIVAAPIHAGRDTSFHSAKTDALGRFSIGALPSGSYSLTAEHPLIDSTGVGIPPRNVTLGDHDSVAVWLAIPSVATLRRSLCPAALADTALGVLLGVVRRLDGVPLPRAVVAIGWSDFDVDRATAAVRPKLLTASVTTDSLGIYRACGVPSARTLFVQAQVSATVQSGVVEERIGESGVLVRDFHVGAVGMRAVATPTVAHVETTERADSALDAPDSNTIRVTGRFVVSGLVVDTKGDPVVAATVQLFGMPRTTSTDAKGVFRLSGLSGGTQGLEVLALGYYPRRLRLEVGDQSTPITIRLERTVTVLDSVRVTAQRVNSRNLSFYREFEDRSRTGLGKYITEEQIEKQHVFATTDLFRMLPGYQVTHPRSGDADSVSIISNHSTGFKTLACEMNIFINGVPVETTDANKMPPNSIHGIEVYDISTAPVKYATHNGCGVVLFWTK